MTFSKTTPSMLAKEIAANIGKKVDYVEMPMDGVKNVAEIIGKFL